MKNTPISRRSFITRLSGGAAACLFPSKLTSYAKENKPNVLFLIADDHAAYVSGTYGNPNARTPNIDKFADSGVKFTNAFVNCPMCTASRQSFLTGRLPHSIRVTQLRTPLNDSTTQTLAEVLKERGYETAAIGKMHFNSSQKHGFDLWIDHPQHRQHLQEHPPRTVPDDPEVLPPWKPFQDPARIWLNGMYAPYGAYDEDMAGTYFARQGEQFLRTPREKPFFLVFSLYEPHSPFHFPIEYRNAFDPASFDVPEPGPEDDGQIPQIFRDLTREEKQRITASYYTSTMFMDKNMGLVLDALHETGFDENTLVVYIGDHGYSLGHHGRFEKHTSFEESVRAPMIWRLPRSDRKGVVSDALVEFIDIFPTIAASCGARIPQEVEGQNLLPILTGEAKEGRETVFSEYYENEEAMIRTQRHKLVFSTGKRLRQDGYQTGLPLPGRTVRLYDLQNDPMEQNNLAEQKDYRALIDHLEMEMLKRFESHPDAGHLPAGLHRRDALEWFLTYREENDSALPKP
ncbi:MAG: DUF4976 domain-containing protein [Candidatus Omnitrophota bacterium]|jgi:choline-sulfatase|nr:MAG: DUF4976 domain-containing protein [Candidatus Omnitrophota bacterium]